MFIFKHFTYQS